MHCKRVLPVVIAVFGLALIAACGGGDTQAGGTGAGGGTGLGGGGGMGTGGGLGAQRFAAHYVDSAPVHGRVFSVVPDKVLINFDFTLAEPSSITVTRNGAAVQTGKTAITGANSLSLTAPLPADGGNGLYEVNYKACWPDRSCHDGRFAFRVDGKATSSYMDLTGKGEVAIDMKDLKFSPARIIVSTGTKVTWTNREAAPHFVNTDPHPSHNNLPDLNSLGLGQGKGYSYTFGRAGEWAYHCSAHYPQGMVGSVLAR